MDLFCAYMHFNTFSLNLYMQEHFNKDVQTIIELEKKDLVGGAVL